MIKTILPIEADYLVIGADAEDIYNSLSLQYDHPAYQFQSYDIGQFSFKMTYSNPEYYQPPPSSHGHNLGQQQVPQPAASNSASMRGKTLSSTSSKTILTIVYRQQHRRRQSSPINSIIGAR